MPCPACGEILGHDIKSGRELYIDEIEADIDDEPTVAEDAPTIGE
jgi:hydrogenase nickel incorporation protein HypA/HybF